MFTDSLGNKYSRVPGAVPTSMHSAKPSKGGKRKYGRSKRKGTGAWVSLVKFRESTHRNRGHKFPTYSC